MVDYHDTEGDYIHYWESWAALAGGEASEASESGHELASKLIALVEHAPEDTACATTAIPTAPSPSPPGVLPTALTPRFLQSGSVVILTPASGEFCRGQVPQLGSAVVGNVDSSTPSQLSFHVPPESRQRPSVGQPELPPRPASAIRRRNFRYPWGFSIENLPNDGSHPSYDSKLSPGNYRRRPRSRLQGPRAPRILRVAGSRSGCQEARSGGLCYGFSLLSWALHAAAHGHRIPLGYLSSPGFSVSAGTSRSLAKRAVATTA